MSDTKWEKFIQHHWWPLSWKSYSTEIWTPEFYDKYYSLVANQGITEMAEFIKEQVLEWENRMKQKCLEAIQKDATEWWKDDFFDNIYNTGLRHCRERISLL